MSRCILALLALLWSAGPAAAEELTADRLGVIYSTANAASSRIAKYYASERKIPAANVIGLSIPDKPVISRDELAPLRRELLDRLPSEVQSLLLVWSRPYAVECMSITTAFAAGYRAAFCEPGCGGTLSNPLFDTTGWLPADTAGWLPAMLLPSADETLARSLIDRGRRADGSAPRGTVYLVRTSDSRRNVRANGYEHTEEVAGSRIRIVELNTPVQITPAAAFGYFTGVERVEELRRIEFLPGAAADHLTSTGGILEGSGQMSALEWLRQGATASYGTVSEPCNHPEKFPSPAVFLDHYMRGDTLLEAYWKSVAMPGQGLFIGEPLARPFARSP